MEISRSGSGQPQYNVNQNRSTENVSIKKDNSQGLPEKEVSLEQKKDSSTDIKEKIKSLNAFLSASNTQLKFSFHEELSEYYVSIIDEKTKEVVKEIPPKKLLDIYAAMRETMSLFIDKKI